MSVITRLIKFLQVGVGISNTDVEYAESTSQTTAPTEGWQTTAPKWRKDYYIWSRTHIYYTDGNEKVSTPMCLSVARSIDSIEECYYSSTSSTAITEGAWAKGKSPTWVSGRYIWTKSIIYYTDGTSTETTPICCTGGQGPQGPQGKPGENGKDGEPGAKGETGATLRGPQSWENCGNGYSFESGASGEEWKDVVIYNSGYYSCIKSHVKSADNYPGSKEDTNNGYWRLGSPIELVVAKIILAQYQLVDNLGVKVIDMQDEQGNTKFLAKDGKVICQGGFFQNVSVSGDISVGRLRYNENTVTDGTSVINGSFIKGWGTYVLPHLKDGEFMRIVVFNPIISRSTLPTVLKCEHTKDEFMPAKMSYTQTRETTIEVNGWYELIGTNELGHTIWVYNNIENNQN